MVCFLALSRLTPWTEVGKQTFFRNLRIANPQIIYVCQSSNRKSANYLRVPVLKSQIRKFLCLIRKSLIRRFVMKKSMYLRTCGSFKSANHKKGWIRKLQIRKVPHLRKFRK